VRFEPKTRLHETRCQRIILETSTVPPARTVPYITATISTVTTNSTAKMCLGVRIPHSGSSSPTANELPDQIVNSDIDGYTTDELEELIPQLENENAQGHESIRRVLTVLKKRQDERKAEKKQKNKEDNERQRSEAIRTNGFSLIVDPDSTFDSCEYCDGDPHDSATPCGCHCH
jgi:hypothetical protein